MIDQEKILCAAVKCKKCLMKEMNWTKENWNEQVESFKLQGCKLF